MSTAQGQATIFHQAMPGLLIGILVPLITNFTFGFEHPIWQTLIVGAVVGGIIGLLYRVIFKR
jgi:uncharacterized membrane protein (DUF106 family)